MPESIKNENDLLEFIDESSADLDNIIAKLADAQIIVTPEMARYVLSMGDAA